MRVTLDGQYRNMISSLKDHMTKITDLNYQISSGKRLQYLSDDPVASAEVIKYKKRLVHIDQYHKDITRANAWLKSTEDALDSVESIVRDLRTQAEQAATESYNYENRKQIAYHVDAMAEEVMQNANTDINGEYIFSGFRTNTKPFNIPDTAFEVTDQFNNTFTVSGYNHSFDLDLKIKAIDTSHYKFSIDGGNTYLDNNGKGFKFGEINSILGFTISGTPYAGEEIEFNIEHEYQGDSGEFKIESNKDQHIDINKTGEEVFTDSNEKNIFKIMGNLWAGLVTNNRDLISQQIDKLNTYEKHNLTLQAWTGSRINILDKISNDMLVKDKDNTTKAISELEDADVSDAMTKLVQAQTIYQATLKATAMISNLNIMNFL